MLKDQPKKEENMKKELLNTLALLGYKVGFGAKKNFSSYDLLESTPKYILGVSLIFFISLLYEPWLSFSVSLGIMIVVHMVLLQLLHYQKEKYAQEGERLTNIFNQLTRLSREIHSYQNEDLGKFWQEMKALQKEFNSTSLTRQILFSGWLAHYKFFIASHREIEWIDQELQFTLKDKIPASYLFFLVLSCLLTFFYFLNFFV